MLPREFYMRDAVIVAQKLLGKLLVHKTPGGVCSGVIIETEAYRGWDDAGAHSYFNRRTERTRIQFGKGGYAYIYFIYGMHTCFNVVTNFPEKPEAVLVRALEPVDGVDAMLRRRKCKKKTDLCNGPGKLCSALEITRELYGEDLCGDKLYIENFKLYEPGEIGVSPRVNIDYAGECRDYLWRFFVKDNPCVSKTASRYRSDITLEVCLDNNINLKNNAGIHYKYR